MIRPADRPVDDRGGLDWLGPEFLTWLWWRSATAPEFPRPDGVSVFVHLDDLLELRGERSASRRTVLRSGVPAASAEGRVALRHGKTASAARLIFARGEEEATLTLRAEDLDASGLRPSAAEGGDAEERLTHALTAVRRAYEDLDLCFAAFLAVRCTPAWDAEAERIRAWVASPSDEETRRLASVYEE